MKRRRDEGSASLELVGLVPTVVALLGLMLYAASFVYTVHAANQAVRDGARALSLGQPAGPAIDRSLPGAVEVAAVTYPSTGGVRLEVRTVDVGYLPQMTVTRYAVMPRTVP
ncbi:TadE family protein [Cellulomonas flavigena DSM 20109]|uniref:TadE family protein n=1 Tax=Cellulomonas flavigena (strain ATCC 482 / DSM 20109 / BCRC 11376 / JCM 18109 / NBRC 3775 / NCIMB 8073 / NRS 134) TaxID=446466 RepID=D5UIB1_CELFN|nr:TadE family protein [Cellulomonas flavigena]ADG75456.1 TadE family protein [Cellulomonas flavigena DSM 20109]